MCEKGFMEKKRILLVGLEENEVIRIKQGLEHLYLVMHYEMLPKVKLEEGVLLVESKTVAGKYMPVDKVIFHGIFENDLDFITLLALWNGPCLPDALGMMNLRQRIPGLVRSLRSSRFNTLRRGMLIGSEPYTSKVDSVAKWGIWHCGEDKAKFNGVWQGPETTVIEDFITGEAVRIMIVGDTYWQIKLTGDSWLKSIHNAGAGSMPVDEELLQDSLNIAKAFGMQMIGIDYMIADDGNRYLLEVNHIPNITVFNFMTDAFIEFANSWIHEELNIHD